MVKYVKSHSNYVLKSKHQETNNGVIYERDITTIGGRDRFSKGQVPIYRSGNFVITVNNDNTTHKKTTNQEWESNDSGDTWTLDILDNYEKDEKSSDDKKIVIKKDYYDLRDFAYFGSCSELIRASINDIIKKFPGELFVPTIKAWVFSDGVKVYNEESAEDYKNRTGLNYTIKTETIEVTYSDYKLRDGEDYTELPIIRNFELPGAANAILFVVDNPFNINIYNNYVPEGADPLKYFANGGINNYVAYKKNANNDWDFNKVFKITASNFVTASTCSPDKCIYIPGDYMGYLSITATCAGSKPEEKIDTCNSSDASNPCAGESAYSYKIHAFMGDNNEVKYFVNLTEHPKAINYRIRPKDDFIEEYYEHLDNFEKILLNRDNSFTATFELIRESDYGYYSDTKDFKFPTTYGDYNLGSSGATFSHYIESLVEIGEYYDDTFTDNLWRSMTHEAIKNFDWTYTRHYNSGDEAEYIEGGDKIKKIIRLYGREFDETRGYIDAIADNNTITYDNINNLPDYFFSDKLEDDGWDVKLVNVLKLTEKANGNDVTCNLSPSNEISNAYNGVHVDRTFSDKQIAVKPYTKEKITSYGEVKCGQKPDMFEFVGDIDTCICDNDNYSSAFTLSAETNISHKDGYYDNCCHFIRTFSSENEYTPADVNSEFLKRLILNSKDIMRYKGTIDSIEMVLGMFGMKSRNYVYSDESYFYISNGNEVKLTDIGKQYYGKTDFEHYIPYDYDIKEYTMFTTRLEDTYDSNKGMYKMDWINSLKLVSYNTENYRNGIYEAYQGLPVEYRQASANKRYIYPSFQNYLPYDGGLYYQMNGGWLSKEPIMFDTKNNIITSSSGALFTETVKNINCVQTLNELLSNKSLALKSGDICQVLEVTSDMENAYAVVDGSVYNLVTEGNDRFFYVTVENFSLTVGNAFFTDFVYISNPYADEQKLKINLNDEAYNGKSLKVYVIKKNGKDIIYAYSNSSSVSTFTIFEHGKYLSNDNNYTNYFRVNNPDFNNELSVLGWKQLKDTDVEYYMMNAISDYNKGNNPHAGHMLYDKGHEYLDRFHHLFKTICNDGLFDLSDTTISDGDIYATAYDFGFNSLTNEDECIKDYDEYIQEDSKCHYFGDLLYKNSNNSVSKFEYNINNFSALYGSAYRKAVLYHDHIGYLEYGCDVDGNKGCGSSDIRDGVTNQIVNTKRVDIEFYLNSKDKYSVEWLEEVKYIESVIMPYLSQVIPSNIILTAKYRNKYHNYDVKETCGGKSYEGATNPNIKSIACNQIEVNVEGIFCESDVKLNVGGEVANVVRNGWNSFDKDNVTVSISSNYYTFNTASYPGVRRNQNRTFVVTGVKNSKICINVDGFNFGSDGALIRVTNNNGCVLREINTDSNKCFFIDAYSTGVNVSIKAKKNGYFFTPEIYNGVAGGQIITFTAIEE